MKGGYECAGVFMLVMMVLMLAQVLVTTKYLIACSTDINWSHLETQSFR